MKYRIITCYRKKENNNKEDIYFRVECISDEQAKMACFRLASPRYEYNSETEAIKSLRDSRIPVALLSGEVVIPFKKNYPREYELQDILKPWDPTVKEIWPGEIED